MLDNGDFDAGGRRVRKTGRNEEERKTVGKGGYMASGQLLGLGRKALEFRHNSTGEGRKGPSAAWARTKTTSSQIHVP